MRQRVVAAFEAHHGRPPRVVARAPGRVNIIGEHTDYNGGLALPAAIDRATWVAATLREDGEAHVQALDFGESDEFPLGDRTQVGGGSWRDYVRGTLAELARAGVGLPGIDLAIAGDVPKGAGLSSSASLEVAIARAGLALAGLDRPPLEVARIAQRAECDFVGLRCGILDQLASAACELGSALLIDCLDNRMQPVPIADDIALLVVQSGVRRGLVEGKYNARRAQCEEAAAAMGVTLLRLADEDMLAAARDRMSPEAFRRARHVLTEDRRTGAMVEALEYHDLARVGEVMRAGHCSMRDDFEASHPAVDRLVDLLDTAIAGRGGARMTGGGFGGAAVALLDATILADVTAALDEYRTPDAAPAELLVTRPAAGASIEWVGAG